MTFLCTPACLVLDCLFLEMLQSLIDRSAHIVALRQCNQRSVSRRDGNFCFVPALLQSENYFGFEFVAKYFADFQQAVSISSRTAGVIS